MTTDAVIELVRIVGVDPPCDRDGIVDGLTAIRRLTSWVEATELRWANALNSASSFPERDLARTNRCSTGVASKLGKTAVDPPAFAVGLTDGVLTGEHVDVLTGVVRGDLVTGMWHLNAIFDPATAVTLAQRLDTTLQDVYSREVSEGCPRDPIAKHDFLRSLALAELMTGDAERGGGGAEVVVIIDLTQPVTEID